ncbi:MAG: guanylate kinase [Frankiaceae bacterium]|nr:guanylate kinase [Frankiaceae bacterium]MDQ1634408.1 guanylate kinase [Frankiaceae bacterium]MDQ1672171.1 guanylate kinase [Frankiaceae bacterium]
MASRLTVLSGPSGVGKGSVVQAVRHRHPDIWISVSATTRSPRPGERHGVDYFFVDVAEFERMRQANELLECASYAGNWYGTPRAAVEERLDDGVRALLEIELQGARQVRESLPTSRLVFLAPPSWQELERRLDLRGTESAEVIRQRLEVARAELAAEGEFDAVVINDEIEAAADRLVALMFD